ncbi:hypothetical protein JCM11641_001590 [Rhodosporidiobolus odoratus]
MIYSFVYLAAIKTGSGSVIDTYVAAVVDLWKQQRAEGVNSFPHPGEWPAVKQMKELTAAKKHERKRKEYVDRGIGSLQDGYTSLDQFKALLKAGFTRETAEGLRDRLTYCLGHYGLLRSNNILPIELADLSTVELKNEGPSPCHVVFALLDHGKTNQEGRQ